MCDILADITFSTLLPFAQLQLISALIFGYLRFSYFYRSKQNKMSYSTEETTKELGYMIIFNQEVFEKFDNRIGSQKDVTSLKATFSKFGMDPIAKESLRLNDIENEINMCNLYK